MTQVVYIETRVKRVWEQIEKVYVNGTGNSAVFESVSRGWFVAFQGSYEALFFGEERPEFQPGDRIKITFEKIK